MQVMTMEIRGIDKGYVSKIYGQKQMKDRETISGETVRDGDRVDISSEAKEMQKLVRETLELEDVRPEKVEDLKNRIHKGQYNVSSKKLADAL